MNDNYIIILCIFFMILVWGIYFKSFIKEGNDPNADNYTMPISFSGEGDNNTITIPKNINSKGSVLNLNNNTNISGDANITGTTNLKNTNIKGAVGLPKNTPIEFGVGENKEVNAGKITYGTWHDNGLCIVGGGGASGQGPRQVHIWDDLTVDHTLNVNNGDINIQNGHWMNVNGGGINTAWMNTNGINTNGDINSNSGNINVNNGDLHLNNWHGMFAKWFRINDTAYVQGIQMGYGSGNHGRINFPNGFVNDNVFVFMTRDGRNDGEMTGFATFDINRWGFSYSQTGAWQGSDYGYVYGWNYYNFRWIAFCA